MRTTKTKMRKSSLRILRKTVTRGRKTVVANIVRGLQTKIVFFDSTAMRAGRLPARRKKTSSCRNNSKNAKSARNSRSSNANCELYYCRQYTTQAQYCFVPGFLRLLIPWELATVGWSLRCETSGSARSTKERESGSGCEAWLLFSITAGTASSARSNLKEQPGVPVKLAALHCEQ